MHTTSMDEDLLDDANIQNQTFAGINIEPLDKKGMVPLEYETDLKRGKSSARDEDQETKPFSWLDNQNIQQPLRNRLVVIEETQEAELSIDEGSKRKRRSTFVSNDMFADKYFQVVTNRLDLQMSSGRHREEIIKSDKSKSQDGQQLLGKAVVNEAS